MAALFERRMRNLISLIVRSVDFAIRAHCCAIYRDRARSTHTAGLKTALFVFLTKYVKSGSAVAFPLPQRRHFVPGTWSFPRIAYRYVVTGTRGTPCLREPTMKRR